MEPHRISRGRRTWFTPAAGVAEKVAATSGGVVDGLVANAGVSAPSPLPMAVNYFGTVRLIDALRPFLAKSDAPRISVTSSAATLQGNDPELVDLLLAGDEEAAMARGAALAAQGPIAGHANYSSPKRATSRGASRPQSRCVPRITGSRRHSTSARCTRSSSRRRTRG